MAKTLVRRPRRKLCVGDLDKRVILQTRKIKEPDFGATDFGEDFVKSDEVWASVKTTSGKVIFDGVAADVRITHEIGIRYNPDVTSETWIILGGNQLDVALVDNLEERNEWMILLCTDRGDKDKEASQA